MRESRGSYGFGVDFRPGGVILQTKNQFRDSNAEKREKRRDRKQNFQPGSKQMAETGVAT
jgi:hypothetical protein